MGGTCSGLTSVNTSKAFKNRVNVGPLPEDRLEKEESKADDLEDTNTDRLGDNAETVELEAQDVFSKGDYNNTEDNVQLIDIDATRAEQYTLIQQDLAQGDHKTEESKDSHEIMKVDIIVTQKEPSSNTDDEGQNKTKTDTKNGAITNGEEGNQNRHDRDMEGPKDSNGNSYENQNENEWKFHITKCPQSEDNAMPSTPPDTPVNQDQKGKENEEEGLFSDQAPQDSLFFLPLVDEKSPIATYKIPERLNRSRKPPLTYNERMLLADCNRFEQLDKKREFAVRQNRSISRHGKLPKIENNNEETNSQDNDFSEQS